MLHDDRLQPGYVVGAPQTFRERLRCLWWFLRYPRHVAIVYPPADADAILNNVRATRRKLEISTRRAKQLKNALTAEKATKGARRIAKMLRK